MRLQTTRCLQVALGRLILTPESSNRNSNSTPTRCEALVAALHCIFLTCKLAKEPRCRRPKGCDGAQLGRRPRRRRDAGREKVARHQRNPRDAICGWRRRFKDSTARGHETGFKGGPAGGAEARGAPSDRNGQAVATSDATRCASRTACFTKTTRYLQDWTRTIGTCCRATGGQSQ